jgi:telomerase reverse transcriptase
LDVRAGAKTSRSDIEKRQEIFSELLYYIFDSIVIPLVRFNFHVTESNKHGNRMFYFRHDVWRALTEPSLAAIKLTMFEEMDTEQAKRLLDARALGFSQVRLVPKGPSVRPIMNLKRRVTKLRNGRMVLGSSINSLLGPVFNMLSFEKTKNPNLLGSALFSVGDMYPRLKAFRARLRDRGLDNSELYFAKLDVQSCFDTIPQHRVVQLMERLCSESNYRMARHAEIKIGEPQNLRKGHEPKPKPMRKFVARAKGVTDFDSFDQVLNNHIAVGKRGTIFVDGVAQPLQAKERLLDLLSEHVERNVVKIGKKFFRQKEGIPQGSVLSSLLCNLFYADFERQCLDFLDGGSLLLRLIDDFLLISTNREHADRFLQVMHDGNEQYGIRVQPEKTLVNFKAMVNKVALCRQTGSAMFPYCGIMIDMITLDISKDRGRRIGSGLEIPSWELEKRQLTF